MSAATAASALHICPTCLRQFPQDVLVCPDDGTALRRFRVQHEDPMIGAVIEERWVIEEKIGEGGMGAVYRAQQRSVDRKVAIKTLRSKLLEGDSKGYLERFLREATLASKINHPHLVSIYDFGQTEDAVLYLVMEHLDGESLAQRQRRQPLSLYEALTLGAQLCQGMAVAHQAQVVHRDLKPENIFLLRSPTRELFVKVLDFGIAKNLDAEQRMTQTGQVFGTPEYMSPEQCRGSMKVDARSDLYSLGCILYELLCGRPPFRDESLLKVLFAHVSDPVSPLRPTSPASMAHEEVVELVMHLLQKRPRDRPKDMVAVYERLSRLAQGVGARELVLPAWSVVADQDDAQDGDALGQADTAELQVAATPTLEPSPGRPLLVLSPVEPQSPAEAEVEALADQALLDHARDEPHDGPSGGLTQAPRWRRVGALGALAVVLTVVSVVVLASGALTPDGHDAAMSPQEPPSIELASLQGPARDGADPRQAPRQEPPQEPPQVEATPDEPGPQDMGRDATQDGEAASQAVSQVARPDPSPAQGAPRKLERPRSKVKRALSEADQLRVAAGARPHAVVKRQTQQLVQRLRPCIDIALRQGERFGEAKTLKVVLSYTISPEGRVEGLFVDPGRSSALPAKVKGCVMGNASGFVFTSDSPVTKPMRVEAQEVTFSLGG